MPIKEKGQNATQIANKGVSTTAPTNGQVLTYNSTSGDWEPAAATGASNAFATIAVSGQDNVVADSGSDTLTIAAGANCTITTTAASDTVTIAAAGAATLDGIEDNVSSNADLVQINDTSVVINKDGDDVDFQVQGDAQANLLYCNAGTSKIGVRTNAPDALFHIDAGSADDVEAFAISEAATARFRMIADFNPGSNLLHFGGYQTRTMMTFDTDGGSDAVAGGHVGFGIDPSTAAEKVVVDGNLALKSQSSAPSATADYAKLYSTGAGTSTDPNVKLLLLGEGSDGASTITDSSTGGKSPSSATAETDTAQYKFGSSSILFERSNSDKITYADHADWDLAGEFSIDFWVRFQNANTGGDSGYGHSCIVRGAGGWRIQWTGLYYTNADSSTDGWEFAYGGSMTRIMFADAISDTNWHHVAITRDASDVIRCYRDGAKKGSNATQASTYACTDLVFGVNGSSDYHDGWVDEFRIISGDDNGWSDDSSITVPAASMGGGYAELYALDASGNATKISPHNPRTGEWEYYSTNQRTGKTVRINMEEVVRDLGQLTGKNYIKGE